MSGYKPEKTMSSRLLTMKFMQRAAASAPATPVDNSCAATPQAANDDTTSSVPSPKRRRISGHGSQRNDAATDRKNADLEVISAAIKAEEEKRAAAIARQAAEAGETEWVLEFPAGTMPQATDQTHILSNGPSGEINDIDEVPEYEGRRSYGNFKRKKKVVDNSSKQTAGTEKSGGMSESANSRNQPDKEEGEHSDDESDSDSEEDDDDDEIAAMIHAAKTKADRQDAKQKYTGKKGHGKGGGPRSGNGLSGGSGSGRVDLSRLTSISGSQKEGHRPQGVQKNKKKKKFR